MKRVAGYEIPENMTPTRSTRKVLNALRKNKVAIFEPDDSPECYETVCQLDEITALIGLIGLLSFTDKTTRKLCLVDEDNAPNVKAYRGKYEVDACCR